ncbi:MAG: DinB family protein [Actinomycetota bacterium]|nr:DinB family protein [Actinomycetota bacterium]
MPDPTIEAAREIFDESVDHLREAIEGLTQEALAWRPAGEESNPITVLAVHGMHSSRWWLTIARGLPLPERDRPSEFEAKSAGDSELLSFVDEMAADCRSRLDPGDAFDPTATRPLPEGEPVSAAWALLHALEHLREHVAQAQLTRQLSQQRS